MDEYEVLGGLHQIIDKDIDIRMKAWLDSHNVNFYLLYPLAAIEVEAILQRPETQDSQFKRCIASFVYSKAIENRKDIYIKKFNAPGFKKYLKSYTTDLYPVYQNYRFSREINDINPMTKPLLERKDTHRYTLTTSLVTDQYNEETFYFYGMDDRQSFVREREERLALNFRFIKMIEREKSGTNDYIDIDLYHECIKIVEKDLNKWGSSVKSPVFDKPNSLARVIAFFYYHAMMRSIILQFYKEDLYNNADKCIMYFDKKSIIKTISEISGLIEYRVKTIVNYLINDGKMNILEFPLFEVGGTLVTIPSVILVNDWQFSIINGHYIKNILIKNREKTISAVTENRIESTLNGITNVAVAKTVPYSYKDDQGKVLNSDIDYAIYDLTHNKILVIEAKWIDRHYKDEIDKIYGKIFQTINSIYTKQIEKHKQFLSKQENIDILFGGSKGYKKGLQRPEVYYLAVDKRNQMHIGDRHMVSEYMLIYFLRKFISGDQLDLEAMWKEISKLQTKVEYIAVSDDYYEIVVNEETVMVEKEDINWT